MHGAKKLILRGKYLKMRENGGRIGDTGYWGLEST
jgi:hypothetical protein